MSTYKSKKRVKQFEQWFERVTANYPTIYYLDMIDKTIYHVAFKIAEKAFYKGFEEGKKETIMNKIIIVDSNAVCRRAKHSMGDLSHEEMKTGVLFGFMRDIYTLATKFETNKFIFAWDSNSSWRKQVYPGYKDNRNKEFTAEEKQLNQLAYDQFTLLKNYIIPKLGFKNNFKVSGYEGDDIIASAIIGVPGDTFGITIVSSDNDLYQLLDEDISMYSLKKKHVYTLVDFHLEWGIEPDEWADVKAIAGCPGDGVIGIEGVKEITAIKYLKGDLKPTSKAYLNIKKGAGLIERNREVVTLPCSHTPVLDINFKDEVLSLDGFLELGDEFNFKSFLTKGEFSKMEKDPAIKIVPIATEIIDKWAELVNRRERIRRSDEGKSLDKAIKKLKRVLEQDESINYV